MNSSKMQMPMDIDLDKLPKVEYWGSYNLYQWEGFWSELQIIKGAISFRSNFEARSEDVILASSMKTGTTWLKALCFTIMATQSSTSEQVEEEENDPLLENIPHVYVPTLEFQTYANNNIPDLSGILSPRLFHTHLPYHLLPDSIKFSECKIIYITRNPKDTFVSMWHFFNKIWRPNQEPFPIDKAFDNFCKGIHMCGPFFDHVLEYWKESLKNPQTILFLKYEDLKKDPKGQVKRLASFLGKSFGEEKEIDRVLDKCSFERLKNLEVNKNGMSPWEGVPNSSFFREGVVGDSKNCFTPTMNERLDQIMRIKLQGSGLDLDV